MCGISANSEAPHGARAAPRGMLVLVVAQSARMSCRHV